MNNLINEYNRRLCLVQNCDIEISDEHMLCSVHNWLTMLISQEVA